MEFFHSRKFKILLAVLAVLFGIMMYSASTSGKAGKTENMLSFLTVPLQQMTTSVSNTVGGFFERFTKYEETQKKNEELQEQLDELRRKLVEYEDLKQENEQLRSITGIKEENPDYTFVLASVVARDPDNLGETFTIDKGTVHGIKLYDPVITSSGLVGIIEEVGSGYSVVTTLLSPKLKVGAYLVGADEQMGVVSGELSMSSKGLTMLTYLEQRPAVGDLIATAGSSGLCPRGIVIGTVKEVHKKESGTTYNAIIQPSNDLNTLKDVFVLTDFLGQDNHG